MAGIVDIRAASEGAAPVGAVDLVVLAAVVSAAVEPLGDGENECRDIFY